MGEWTSSNGITSSSGNRVSIENGYYYTSSTPYTLTHDDVVIENGRMVHYQPKLHYPNIVIPNVLDDQNVTAIEDRVFYARNLSTVDFTAMTNLTTIGYQAFLENKLVDVDLSGLTKLAIIDYEAFKFNNTLTTLDLSGLTSLISIGVLAFSFNDLESVNFTGLTSLTTIGSYAFTSNNLESVDFSGLHHLTFIGRGAFGQNPNLSTFVLPTPTVAGYVFDGWKSFGSNVYESGEEVFSYNEYQAVVIDLVDYQLTYNTEGGTHDNPATYTVEDAMTFAAATKDGHTFEGWFTDAAFTTPIAEIPAGSTGDLELFARFTENVLGLADGAPISVVPYPNPVSSSFALDVDIDQIHVVNLGGQVVHTFGERQARYDVAHLAPGSYVLRLFKAGQSVGAARIIIALDAQ